MNQFPRIEQAAEDVRKQFIALDRSFHLNRERFVDYGKRNLTIEENCKMASVSENIFAPIGARAQASPSAKNSEPKGYTANKNSITKEDHRK